MFQLTKHILNGYYKDECNIYLCYGMPEGIGKSAYVIKTIAEIHGRPKPTLVENWPFDYEAAKRLIKFYPQDIVMLCKHMVDREKRHEAFIWDDAGLWLNAMEWNDPFIVAFTKYLNIARTNWAGVVLTTPVPEWVLKKIRTSEGLIFIKISKIPQSYATDTGHYKTKRVRVAKAYRRWVAPDRKKTGVRLLHQDRYDATLPNEFYDWYKPLRDSYAKEAVEQMFNSLKDKWDAAVTDARRQIIQKDLEYFDTFKWNINEANDKSEDLIEALDSQELPLSPPR